MSKSEYVMAADSKPFTRGGGITNQFKGSLGVCLGFNNPEDFKTQYEAEVNSILKKLGVTKNRTVLKSYDLSVIFQEDRSALLSCLKDFVGFLVKNKVDINCAFTTLNTQLLSQGVTKYGTGRYPAEQKKTLDFLDELAGYYPPIAAWKVARYLQLKGTTVYLDSFTGEYTPAWGELCARQNVFVLPKGDQCNPLISSADLVTKYIDEYLFHSRLPLKDMGIKQSLDDCGATKSNVFYVGHPDLVNIVPTKKEKLTFVKQYKRPLIYVLKEKLIEKESEYIERSPVWDKLLNFAFKTGTGIKFISEDEDYRTITKGDYLVYLGVGGQKQAEYLRDSLGYPITPISHSQLQ